MNLLGAMCWLSRDTTEGAETRSNRVQRARGGEELTGRKGDFSVRIPKNARITQERVAAHASTILIAASTLPSRNCMSILSTQQF